MNVTEQVIKPLWCAYFRRQKFSFEAHVVRKTGASFTGFWHVCHGYKMRDCITCVRRHAVSTARSMIIDNIGTSSRTLRPAISISGTYRQSKTPNSRWWPRFIRHVSLSLPRRQGSCQLVTDLLRGSYVETGVMEFGLDSVDCTRCRLVDFLARDSICYSAICHRPSVYLFVCPSHGWISQRRLKLGSRNFHHK